MCRGASGEHRRSIVGASLEHAGSILGCLGGIGWHLGCFGGGWGAEGVMGCGVA